MCFFESCTTLAISLKPKHACVIVGPDSRLRMRCWQLNTFMYAPKDDAKHRAQWREPYTVEEAEELQGLIAASKENGIDFYYAISPGLDIIYSNAKEVATLKRKLEQIASFGVTAFAILFDDIEPEIGAADKEVFETFAQAQVAITNEMYQALGQPKFIFCPTEYCASRAVPNVQNSEYLSTIGQKLLQGIDIMWTGNKVISKNITLKSIQELQDILRRSPLIWDNLHANDYDHKRVFLGPYSGRSTRLIPHLRGVLTNPNCEYEANFIAIHTLAQWSRCTSDACKSVDDSSSCESVDSCGSISCPGGASCLGSTRGTLSAASPLPVDFPEDEVPSRLPAHSYHPRRALQEAIQEWLPEFNNTTKSAYGRVINTDTLLPPNTTTASTTATNIEVTSSGEVLAPPLSSELVSTLVSGSATTVSGTGSSGGAKPAIASNLLEPMDCNPTPPRSVSPSRVDDGTVEDEPVEAPAANELPVGVDEVETKAVEEEMQTEEVPLPPSAANGSEDPGESSKSRGGPIDSSEVGLLVDLFYLPFEHGRQGIEFLQDFAWLKGNAHYVATKRNDTELDEWYRRATKFDQMTQRVNQLSEKLMFIPNRSLLYDLNPYVWDIKGVISLINAYIKWIGYSKGYGKQAFLPGEQEPWVFRGGLTAELQRLLPLDTVHDLFLYKAPDTPINKTYTIRPYLASDERAVYEVCSRTCIDGEDGTMEFEGYPDLIGDKTIGGFLALSSEFSFVMEDENRVVGYALAAVNAAEFFKRLDIAWTSELKEKYPLPTVEASEIKENAVKDQTNQITRADEIINGLHSPSSPTWTTYPAYPSLLVMALLPQIDDGSLAKRLLACAIAALKANGSHGAHVKLNAADHNMINFYARLGFQEICREDNDETVVLGRMF
ncbi:protein O-GlcNAcase-like isoform X3 [Varroa destructor]|nr:protein O-GlcNAcase-like isoform X3 [Varroa destructor]